MEREQEHEESQESTQQEETSTNTAENQPTQQPQNQSPSIESDGRALYLSVLQEKNRELEALRAQLSAKKEEPPAPITPEQEQQFFTNPLSQTRDLVRTEIQQAIQPLMQLVSGFQKDSAYTRMKSQVKQNPIIGSLLAENESVVDQLMNGVDPTEANLTAAILQAKGLVAAGLYQNNTPPATGPVNNPPVPNNSQPTNRNNPTDMTIPAHLRPSAPPAPKDNTQPVKKPLSENERRLMREWGMTEEEYRNGQKEGSLVLEPETNVGKKRTPTNKENANA